MSGGARVGPRWRIRVLSGPQRGAATDVLGRRISLGDAPGLDVRLASPGSDRRLQTVEIATDWASPFLGPVVRAARPTTGSGEEPPRRLTRGALTLTAVGPRGERTDGPKVHVRRIRPGRGLRRLAAATLVAGVALGAAAPSWAPAIREIDLRAIFASAARTPAEQTEPAPEAFLDPVLALQRRLERAGLQDAVTVRRVTASELRVEGVVTAARAPRWELVRDWFLGRFEDRVVLAVRLGAETPAADVPVRLIGVDRGPPPLARLADGRVVALGEIVADGWMLARIERNAIEVTRDGARARLETPRR